MNENVSASSVKELGKQLYQIYCDRSLPHHPREVLIDRVTESLAIFVAQNAIFLSVREFSLNADCFEEMTGYSKKEVKDIVRFACRLNRVCAEHTIKIESDESLNDYFYKIFVSLSMIRTKFPVFLWTGVALYLVIEQCAI